MRVIENLRSTERLRDFSGPEDYQRMLNEQLSKQEVIESKGMRRPPFRRPIRRPVEVVGCSKTAIMGAVTTDWFKEKIKQKLKSSSSNTKTY
ncbi:MAG: hypothetical protein R2827_15900 [Bdellovibrionales bacterium]